MSSSDAGPEPWPRRSLDASTPGLSAGRQTMVPSGTAEERSRLSRQRMVLFHRGFQWEPWHGLPRFPLKEPRSCGKECAFQQGPSVLGSHESAPRTVRGLSKSDSVEAVDRCIVSKPRPLHCATAVYAPLATDSMSSSCSVQGWPCWRALDSHSHASILVIERLAGASSCATPSSAPGRC